MDNQLDHNTTKCQQNLLQPPFPLIEKQLDNIFLEFLPEIISEFLPMYQQLPGGGVWHDGQGRFVFMDGLCADAKKSTYSRLEILIADSLDLSPQRTRELLLSFLAEKFEDEDAAEMLEYFNQIIWARKYAARWSLPTAEIYKKYMLRGREYVLVRCPICKAIHTHGNRPFTLRTTHCRDQEKQYLIGELYHG